MPVLRNVWRGSKTLGLASLAFIVGSIAWAALTGVVAGLLDTVGIHLSGPLLVSLSPIAGLAVAGYAVSEVGA